MAALFLWFYPGLLSMQERGRDAYEDLRAAGPAMTRPGILQATARLIHLWGPALVQMGLIFYFSAQPRDSVVLERFPVPGFLGHLGGYALLGLLVYRAFSGGNLAWRGENGLKTFIFCLIYAFSDEFHQLFVFGRQAAIADVIIDALGVAAALLLVRLLPVARGLLGRADRAGDREGSS